MYISDMCRGAFTRNCYPELIETSVGDVFEVNKPAIQDLVHAPGDFVVGVRIGHIPSCFCILVENIHFVASVVNVVFVTNYNPSVLFYELDVVVV